MSLDLERKHDWVREFQLNGFVVLRNFLPRDLVDGMRDQLTPLLEAEHAKALADDWGQGRSEGRLALHLEKYVGLPLGPLRDERYSRNPVIEDLVNEILGEGQWKRGWTTVEACWPGSRHMAWHSDQMPGHADDPDRANETIRVTFNIPLVEFGWRTGAMEVLPATHRLPHNWRGLDGVSNIYPHLLRLDPGDAVLRDGNILHRGNAQPGRGAATDAGPDLSQVQR